MTAQIMRLREPLTYQRCDDVPSAMSRAVWLYGMIGVTTLNLCITTYAETLRAYGYGR